MWFSKTNKSDPNALRMPPAVPLRKPAFKVTDLAEGKLVRFSDRCPLPPLSGGQGVVVARRLYRFGQDSVLAFQLRVGRATHYYLTIAEDDQGSYLVLSRLLNEAEQESWFGRDALGFFTEASSAKSIRCKADLMIEGEWAAARYSKSVDWVEGEVAQGQQKLSHSIHYSLLVNEHGDKALEIEHEDASGQNRFMVTVYRPMSDITAIETASAEALVVPPEEPAPPIPANDDVPLFLATPEQKPRNDFRRIEETQEPIHIERTPATLEVKTETPVELPSFLVPKEGNYLELDQVLPPEPERVRVGLSAARSLIELAQRKQVRVRDVLRDMLGLQSALSEEVIFELPLSDEDYRTLAMRYKLRPDHRVEIRSRLEEELRQKLGMGNKA